MFGRRLAGIAKGFGLQDATITSIDQIGGLLEEFKASKEPTLWDFHTSDGCGANLRYADMRIGCAVLPSGFRDRPARLWAQLRREHQDAAGRIVPYGCGASVRCRRS